MISYHAHVLLHAVQLDTARAYRLPAHARLGEPQRHGAANALRRAGHDDDLAVENGEVQGEAGKDWTTLTSTRPQWIRDKKINILFQMGTKPHTELKDVPTAIDLAWTPDDRRIMEIVFAKFGMSRPFFAPPGIAPERLATLRRAFDETVHDEAFLADAAKLGMEINPVRGEDIQALVTRIMSTPPELAQRTRDILKPQ
jgi:hypothetical protein